MTTGTAEAGMRPRRPARLPPDHPPVLLVVVDTEEEFDWAGGFSREHTSVTAMSSVDRAQSVAEEFDITPTYVVDYPVANQPEGSEPLRFRGHLQDKSGDAIPVDCSVTRFGTRNRTLALVLARPC